MTDKRFIFVIDNGENTIYDLNKKGSVFENFNEIEEMLNSLNDENEQLKAELYFWKKQAKQCPMRSCNE